MVSNSNQLELEKYLQYDNIFCEREPIIIRYGLFSKIAFLMYNKLIDINYSVYILKLYIHLPYIQIEPLLKYYNQLFNFITNKNILLENNTYIINNNNIDIFNIPIEYKNLFIYNSSENRLSFNTEILDCLTDIFNHVNYDSLLDEE